MIKIISKTGKKTHCRMTGSRFDVANEAVNISVMLVNSISDIDAALGDIVRRKIVDALEGRAKPIGEQKEETEAE